MKAGLLTVAALTATATAQVHRRHAHQHQHKGREAVEAVEYETAHAPHAIVYVDQNGKPISTAYGNAPAETPAAYQAPAAPAAASPAENKPASYGANKDNKLGIVYSPYRDAGGCKDQGEVSKDFEKFADYSFVRIYGTDCEQVSTVLTAAKAKNMKIMAGIFDITQVQAEAQKIIDAVKGDWSAIDTVSIGNELVNAGTKSPGEVVAAVNQGRGILRGAGFKGDVVTVDTFVAMIAHPELCQASDHAAANCHAFFDGGRTAEQAGEFVKEQAERVKQACGGKKTVITESGWPHTGASNGAAVPSKENQQKAIASLKSKFTEGLVLFTAFDDIWKKNTAATYGAEQYWGFL